MLISVLGVIGTTTYFRQFQVISTSILYLSGKIIIIHPLVNIVDSAFAKQVKSLWGVLEDSALLFEKQVGLVATSAFYSLDLICWLHFLTLCWWGMPMSGETLWHLSKTLWYFQPQNHRICPNLLDIPNVMISLLCDISTLGAVFPGYFQFDQKCPKDFPSWAAEGKHFAKLEDPPPPAGIWHPYSTSHWC